MPTISLRCVASIDLAVEDIDSGIDAMISSSGLESGGQVGVRKVDEHIWLVTFMHYDFWYFDDETCRREPIANPFGLVG